MLEFQEKRKLRRFLYSRLTLVVLVVIIGLVLKAVWGVYEKQKTTADNLNKIAGSFADLQARQKMLSAEVEKLNTTAGLETEIRDKFGLVKPGEQVITVVDNGGDTNAAASSTGFWQKILNWWK